MAPAIPRSGPRPGACRPDGLRPTGDRRRRAIGATRSVRPRRPRRSSASTDWASVTSLDLGQDLGRQFARVRRLGRSGAEPIERGTRTMSGARPAPRPPGEAAESASSRRSPGKRCILLSNIRPSRSDHDRGRHVLERSARRPERLRAAWRRVASSESRTRQKVIERCPQGFAGISFKPDRADNSEQNRARLDGEWTSRHRLRADQRRWIGREPGQRNPRAGLRDRSSNGGLPEITSRPEPRVREVRRESAHPIRGVGRRPIQSRASAEFARSRSRTRRQQ